MQSEELWRLLVQVVVILKLCAFCYLLPLVFTIRPLKRVRLRSCNCGAHWWVKRWGFWRHLDTSPFNDKLQDMWSIWTFEFRDELVLNRDDLARMGYPNGPIWEDGRPMWKRSKLQRSVSSESYCVRCASRGP